MEPGLTLFQITYFPDEQSEETLTPLVQFLVSELTLADCLNRFIQQFTPYRVMDMKACAPACLIVMGE